MSGFEEGSYAEQLDDKLHSGGELTESERKTLSFVLSLLPEYVSLVEGLVETNRVRTRESMRRHEQIKEMLTRGEKVAVVAAELGISERTVYRHKSRL